MGFRVKIMVNAHSWVFFLGCWKRTELARSKCFVFFGLAGVSKSFTWGTGTRGERLVHASFAKIEIELVFVRIGAAV